MKYLLLLVSALALAPSAYAQYDTAYYGVALGGFDYSEENFIGERLFDASGDSYRLMVGYLFNEHMAFEGGYGKARSLTDSSDFESFGTPFTVNFRSEFKILTVRFLGVLPFENGITLLGGLGYADMDQDAVYDLVGIGEQPLETEDGVPTYFAGVQYDWDRVAVRFAYEKYGDYDDVIGIEETSVAFFYKL
jgi:hypothetical protein